MLTGPGKLFGLHSGDGRILWSSTIAAAGSSGSDGGSNQHLRLWRRFHDLTHAPQVVVLTTAAATADVHVVNAHSGQQLQHEQLPYAVDKVGRLPPQHVDIKQGWVNASTATAGSLQGLRSGCLCIQCLRKAVRQAEGQSDCFACMYCYRELHSGSVCCPCAAHGAERACRPVARYKYCSTNGCMACVHVYCAPVGRGCFFWKRPTRLWHSNFPRHLSQQGRDINCVTAGDPCPGWCARWCSRAVQLPPGRARPDSSRRRPSCTHLPRHTRCLSRHSCQQQQHLLLATAAAAG